MNIQDPYKLAQLRRQGKEGSLTAKEKKSSQVIAAFPAIAAGPGLVAPPAFGGNQAWYNSKTQRQAGCGPVAAANTLGCLAAQNTKWGAATGISAYKYGKIPQQWYLQFMEKAYKAVGTLEIPIWKDIVEKSDKTFPIPPSLGREAAGYESGVLRFTAGYGIYLKAHRLLTGFCGRRQAFAFIQKGLFCGSPVTLLTGWNRHPASIFAQGYEKAATPLEKGIKQHFVCIVGVRANPGTGALELLASSWGKVCAINFVSLWESWQSPAAFGSALFYFTESQSRLQTKAQMLSAYTAGVEAALKTVSGTVSMPFKRYFEK